MSNPGCTPRENANGSQGSQRDFQLRRRARWFGYYLLQGCDNSAKGQAWLTRCPRVGWHWATLGLELTHIPHGLPKPFWNSTNLFKTTVQALQFQNVFVFCCTSCFKVKRGSESTILHLPRASPDPTQPTKGYALSPGDTHI